VHAGAPCAAKGDNVIRALIRLVLTIVGNAIGLIVADLLLDDFSLNLDGFVVALLVFTVAAAIIDPLITRTAMRNMEALQGGTALITTFLALLVADLISSGIEISGAGTWILATLIVWLSTVLAGVILPLIFLRNRVQDRR